MSVWAREKTSEAASPQPVTSIALLIFKEGGSVKKLLGTALSGLLFSACPTGPGVAPPTDQLFFPVSVTADAAGQKLYIANGNFNTNFDGGTIVVLDLARIEADGQACRAAQQNNTAAPAGCQIIAPSPPTLCVTKDGRCSITDLSMPYIDKAATVTTASFAGDFLSLPGSNRFFFTVRGDQSLSFIDINPTATGDAAIDCAATLVETGVGTDPTRRRCSGDHVLLSDREGNDDFGTIIPGFSSGVFATALDIGREVPGVGTTDLLYVSHLDNGFLSVFRLAPDGTPLFQRSEQLNIGVNQMAVQPQTGILFVIRRTLVVDGATANGDSIELVQPRISDDDASQIELFSIGSLQLSLLDSGGLDYRSIAFGKNGDRLYVGMANPSSVVILNTSLDQFGEPKNQILARIDVDQVPEQMELVQTADGGELLYITDFNNGRVHVIDGDLIDAGGARTSINVGAGPFGIEQVTLPGNLRRLVVTNFAEDTLSFIDADPASPTHNQVLYRVGAPRPAEEN
jgi:DNA-binding beta-propeller fold protein YncE